MGRNENGIDRIIRVVIAIAAVVGAAALGFGTVGAWILLVVAAIMLVTAVTGFCPLYRVFGLSTFKARA
jgi:fatty acid desaturase